ncbi:hypothetical protein ACFVVU_30620 [Kitasatospora sp. NPDC057965]|uniref:hypothetical protein n=1 Tax=Kitasatospora sp. NPDC057965 TaxID=3346291 RepID=UPI0036DA3A5E
MADISFTPGDAGAITARLGPDVPDSAHRLLEQNGATRSAPGEYLFTGPDAVARAAQSAFLLDAGELSVETASGPVRSLDAALDGADVVFARHPTEGIVAATTTDATTGLVPDVLRRFGWQHDGSAPDRDIYLPPADASERLALAAAARASAVLQGLGLQVATVGLATPPASSNRLAEAAEDLVLERAGLRSLTDSRDVADLLDAALDPRTGALPNLDQLLADVRIYLDQLPPDQGELLAARADTARHRTQGLAQGLRELQSDLAHLGAVVEEPTATARSARATAASVVTARGLSAGPIIQAAPAAHALSSVPMHAASR